MWRSAPSHCKWNKIINFVISEIAMWYIYFLCNSFSLRFSDKVSKQTLDRNNAYYFLFTTFFSHVNNNGFYFFHLIPLNITTVVPKPVNTIDGQLKNVNSHNSRIGNNFFHIKLDFAQFKLTADFTQKHFNGRRSSKCLCAVIVTNESHVSEGSSRRRCS